MLSRILILLTIMSSLFGTTINVPGDYSGIQEAINASTDGDTVLVAAGTYTENLSVVDKNIHLASLYLTTGDTSKITSTIVYGGYVTSTINISSTSGEEAGSVKITGLTIQGGGASTFDHHGGAILINDNRSLTLRGCIIQGSRASIGGGLYSNNTDSLMIHNSIFRNNYGNEYGGGLYVTGQGDYFMINNSLVHDNSVGIFDGGGLYLDGNHKKIILHTNVAYNVIPQGRTGGGMRASASADSVLIMNSVFHGNGTDAYDVDGWKGVVIDGQKLAAFNSYFKPSNGPDGYPALDPERGADNIFSDVIPFASYELANYSEALGAGRSSVQFDGETISAPSKDYYGNDRPRPSGTNPDLGAVENALSEPRYNRYTVAQDGSGHFT
ncbi:MAG: hypothetical protein QF780_06455, partial [Candidatus Marinimicrobia bacterium]|nr:hypothetical protein [Candidatus Neomarinimicrobiota bacterium]